MSNTVIFNYYTGEKIQGLIKPPPVDWFVNNVLIPCVEWDEKNRITKDKEVYKEAHR